MSYEQGALDEINKLKSQIEYLKKTNRCIAKRGGEGDSDLIWITRHELKTLSDIEQLGGLKQYKIYILKTVMEEYGKFGGRFDNFYNDYVVNLEQGDEKV